CAVGDGAVVEVQAGDGEAGTRVGRLFLDIDDLAVGVECRHAIALRIADVVTEYSGAVAARIGVLQRPGQPVPVEDVVAQHEAAGLAVDEVPADGEGLGQAVRFGLRCV